MVTELTGDVWWVDLQGVNAYLVDDGALTLVDTGMPWHADRLRAAVSKFGGLAEVERVLITHFDFDHVGGLDRLSRLDATLYVGADDAPYLTGAEKPPWDNRKGALQRATDWFRSTPDLPVETVEDGDTVGSFSAYHTPGHTPGHTAFVSEELSLGLLGDLVQESDGRLELPPWYLAYDDDEARESLLEFADRTPEFEVACMGHGTPFVSDGSERVATGAETARAESASEAG